MRIKDHGFDGFCSLEIQMRRWLVQKKNVGAAGKGTNQRKFLLLTT